MSGKTSTRPGWPRRRASRWATSLVRRPGPSPKVPGHPAGAPRRVSQPITARRPRCVRRRQMWQRVSLSRARPPLAPCRSGLRGARWRPVVGPRSSEQDGRGDEVECHRCSTISSAWEARGRSNPRPARVLAWRAIALRPVIEPDASRRARTAPPRAQVVGAESLRFAAAAGGGCTRPRGRRINGDHGGLDHRRRSVALL